MIWVKEGMTMNITSARLYQISMPLLHPFNTSEGQMTTKDCLILEFTDADGHHGYSEDSAFTTPYYTPEFSEGDFLLLTKQILPRIVHHSFADPDEADGAMAFIKGNQMAKAAVNCALWDLAAKEANRPLAAMLGGDKEQVEAGISIGIQPDPATLVKKVGQAVQAGYRRVKVKIKPGADLAYLTAVREAYPGLMLMADANSAYTLSDLAHLKDFDRLNLLMIEQPLAAGDLVDHARLQEKLTTPICLDESVNSLKDAEDMVALGAGQIINVKCARVGGLSEAKRIQAFAMDHGVACWAGGMVDSGIGRATNLAMATLPGFTLPNDLSASARFFDEDIITPPVTLDGNFVKVPTGPGLGYEVNWANLARFTTNSVTID